MAAEACLTMNSASGAILRSSAGKLICDQQLLQEFLAPVGFLGSVFADSKMEQRFGYLGKNKEKPVHEFSAPFDFAQGENSEIKKNQPFGWSFL
ncbi:MAG: hypothetical protein ACR2KZ_08815 [Segetibacter sp.]